MKSRRVGLAREWKNQFAYRYTFIVGYNETLQIRDPDGKPLGTFAKSNRYMKIPGAPHEVEAEINISMGMAGDGLCGESWWVRWRAAVAAWWDGFCRQLGLQVHF